MSLHGRSPLQQWSLCTARPIVEGTGSSLVHFHLSQPTKMHFCGILKGGGNTLFEGILVFIIFRSTRIAHQFVHFQLVGGIQEKSLCRLVKMMIVCSHLRLPHLSEIGPHPLQRHHSLKQTISTIKKI